MRGAVVSALSVRVSGYSRRVRSYEYPEDEFDAPQAQGQEPVGVHRAPVPGWHAWVPLLAVLIIVPLLAWGAVALLGRSGHPASDLVAQRQSATPAASAAPTQEAEPTPSADSETVQAQTEPAEEAQPAQATQTPPASADMTTGVTVYNGSKVNGLAGRTAERLRGGGYTNVTVQPGQYHSSDPAQSTVYYADASREATAKAVASSLGIANVVMSAEGASSNPVVIVLRSDFKE